MARSQLNILFVEMVPRTDVTSYMCNGRWKIRGALITVLNEFDGLVRPWTQGTFELGVTVQYD